jgi:3-dehydroquinate synthase class II
MGKKPAVKTAHPASALAKEDLVTQVLNMQQQQAELYEAIMAQGQEEAYSLVKEAISRSLEKGKMVLLKEGYEKGLKEGVEQGRMAERKEWEMKNVKIKVDEDVQMGPTVCVMTNSSMQTSTTANHQCASP